MLHVALLILSRLNLPMGPHAASHLTLTNLQNYLSTVRTAQCHSFHHRRNKLWQIESRAGSRSTISLMV